MVNLPNFKAEFRNVSSFIKDSSTVVVGVFRDSKKKAILPKRPYDQTVKKLEKTKVFDGKQSAIHCLWVWVRLQS
jgi:hypothetical protein